MLDLSIRCGTALLLKLLQPVLSLGQSSRQSNERGDIEHHGDQGGLLLSPRQVEDGGGFKRPAARQCQSDESNFIAHVRMGSTNLGELFS